MCLSTAVMGDATHVRLSGDSLSAYVCFGQCWLVLRGSHIRHQHFHQKPLDFRVGAAQWSCCPLPSLPPALYGVVPHENVQLSWTPPGELAV